MRNWTALAVCVPLISLGTTPIAAAQSAAETAIILSGTGQSQGRAARSLGSAVSQSMNRASAAIQQRPSGSYNAGYAAASRRAHTAHAPDAIPANIDPLAGTNAPTYKLNNGSSIRVSGRLIEAPGTTCAKNCPAKPAP